MCSQVDIHLTVCHSVSGHALATIHEGPVEEVHLISVCLLACTSMSIFIPCVTVANTQGINLVYGNSLR